MSLVQSQLVDQTLTLCGTAANPLFVASEEPAQIPLQSLTGIDTTTTDQTLVAGVPGKRIKVYAVSATAPNSTSAVTASFTDGPGGSALYQLLVQAPTQSSFSFATAVSHPSYLFATSPGNSLDLQLSGSSAQLNFNLSYWIE